MIVPAIDGKGHTGRVIRVALAAAYIHRSDNLGVDPVFVVIGGDDGILRLLLEPHDTKPKRRLDIRIGGVFVGRSGPCRIAKIRRFQEHGQRKVFGGQRPHPIAELASHDFIIEDRFGRSSGYHDSLKLIISNGFQKDLVLPAYESIEVHATIIGNSPNHLLIRKVTFNGFDVISAISANNSWDGLSWFNAGIASLHRG